MSTRNRHSVQSPLESLFYSLQHEKSNKGRSIYDLVREYSKCWKALPEEAKAGHNGPYGTLATQTLDLVKSSYASLIDLLPSSPTSAAIVDGQSRRNISHHKLRQFVSNFRIPVKLGSQVSTVAVAVPNGALLGVVSIAVSAYYTLAPIDPTGGPEQFRADILRTGSKVLLVQESDLRRLGIDQSWVDELDIDVQLIQKQDDLTFSLSPFLKNRPIIYSEDRKTPNTADDICLILFTSGTSGTKKIVPFTLHSIVSSVAFVGESWALTSRDVCLNMMPLNHIGGLARNLFAPILLGGSTICCSAFDPNMFWDLVDEIGPTWYYASPSMHAVILDEAASREESVRKSQIRMVCNAAGGLLPSLANRLRTTFNCTVLPSYGMTECMPISTPLMDYKLERPGTSGISIGPEIAILDARDTLVAPNVIGRISVRGQPVFAGYLKDGRIDSSCFTADGWFDTGDLGYLDNDGYLYITGRSKEVINRGGELISPFEIEEAVMTQSQTVGSIIYGRVSECLAFSVPHHVLQEVVGIALVTPASQQRVDLRLIQAAIRGSLHSTKWPVMVVFMDKLPKRNGKLCRVNLSQRFGWEPISDEYNASLRHYEASCPELNAPISTPISNRVCAYPIAEVRSAVKTISKGKLETLVMLNEGTGHLDAIIAPLHFSELSVLDSETIKTQLREILPGYLVPARVTLHSPFPKDQSGQIDHSFAMNIFTAESRHRRMTSEIGISPLEKQLCSIYSHILNIPREDIGTQSSFFDLGGDSLRAGRLLSAVRKEIGVRVPIDRFFCAATVEDMCIFIEEHQKATPSESEKYDSLESDLSAKTYSSTRPSQLLAHLSPFYFFIPLRKTLFWLFVLQSWQFMLFNAKGIIDRRAYRALFLPAAILVTKIIMDFVTPVLSLLTKWVFVGKHREGTYPMWSPYHTKWWLAQRSYQLFGLGVFHHFNWSRVLFYRLMGAKIGKNVIIEPGTILGEYDLIEIGDNVELDRCTVRPFGAERNTQMYLGKIVIGKNSSAGLKTIIAPGARIPENTHLGIQSSSWELQDATESNREKLASRIPKPHWFLWYFVGLPLVLFIRFLSIAPWIIGLVLFKALRPPNDNHDVAGLIDWFSTPTRVAFHYCARVLTGIIAPVVILFSTIALKQIMDKSFGKLRPCSNFQLRQVDKLRTAIIDELLPNGYISEVTGLFGTHYEMTSKIVRLLGGRVGERVYWPGNGPTIQNFDLIDIGDDVVFGSRSYILTSDGHGCDYVRISDGAMVADRVIITPGGTVGEQAVLGSGTLTRRNGAYGPSSVYIGSRAGGPVCLSAGSTPDYAASPTENQDMEMLWSEKLSALDKEGGLRPPSLESRPYTPSCASNSPLLGSSSSASTTSESSSPFGRAFYQGLAPYKVNSINTITAYSMIVNVFITLYWNTPTVLALQLLSRISRMTPTFPLYRVFVLLPIFSAFLLIFSFLALAICILAKHVVIGTRRPGNYDWDLSPYCQRWQLLLTIERLRGSTLGGESDGLLSLLTGTAYLPLYYRLLGARIGKDAALFAGGHMTLPFTEPDLLTLGDRVCVDDASLVAHINSRGTFDLNALFVGDRGVLRTGSRLLSGAKMGADSVLLEHTLVMAGDDVEDGGVCQGWPADGFRGRRVFSEKKDGQIEEEDKWFNWPWSCTKGQGYEKLTTMEMTERFDL
jgi:acyl-CoA synthetase (AMP-forming)/AMP-acid ligase II/acetyltransferase-like isoleucine patch superfamily enzyme/acyl carrier protein